MPTITLVKTPRTVVASVACVPGTPQRGTVDLRTAQGGTLTLKMTNGATGPTLQCVANMLIAHNAGATPAAASAGPDWKTLWSVGGGIVANAITEQSMDVPPGVMHLAVEFKDNTAQNVTVEAFLSEITNATSA